MFPTLITLYVLHHEDNDTGYQRGLDFLRDMDDERVATYIKFPESVKTNIYTCIHACSNALYLYYWSCVCLSYMYVCRHLCKKVAGEDADIEILKVRQFCLCPHHSHSSSVLLYKSRLTIIRILCCVQVIDQASSCLRVIRYFWCAHDLTYLADIIRDNAMVEDASRVPLQLTVYTRRISDQLQRCLYQAQ